MLDYDDFDYLGDFDPDWRKSAACASVDPELFFPPNGRSAEAKQAQMVCAGCPVRRECLEEALESDEQFGVWGGMIDNDRRKLLGQNPRYRRRITTDRAA